MQRPRWRNVPSNLLAAECAILEAFELADICLMQTRSTNFPQKQENDQPLSKDLYRNAGVILPSCTEFLLSGYKWALCFLSARQEWRQGPQTMLPQIYGANSRRACSSAGEAPRSTSHSPGSKGAAGGRARSTRSNWLKCYYKIVVLLSRKRGEVGRCNGTGMSSAHESLRTSPPYHSRAR